MSRSKGRSRLAELCLGLILIHGAWIYRCVLAMDYEEMYREEIYHEQIYRDSNGARIPSETVSRTCGRYGPIVAEDITLFQNLMKLDRERIPERFVHAVGAGAFGYFEVTHDITRYCRAAVFSKIGERTPIVARFSTSVGERGTSDVVRDPRGMAVKFYTSEGNWDIVGLTQPIFVNRDPMTFIPSTHVNRKRNPRSNLADPDSQWDFTTLRHETLFRTLMVMTDMGTPDGYRYMDGFGINTFTLVNSQRVPFYCKFHMKTDQGIRNLTADEAMERSSMNPMYSAQDLWEAIERGDYPSWTLAIQVMTIEEAKQFRHSVFDATKLWPEEEYPLIPVGRLMLNRNPDNWFEQIEQSAFCPSNLVPGIEPSADIILQARLFSYRDSQQHRLGSNFLQLPVNRPQNFYELRNLERDGPMRYYNEGNATNYYPNTRDNYHPDPSVEFVNYNVTGVVGRFDTKDDDNYSQPRIWYSKLSDYDKLATAKNIATNIKDIRPELQVRVIETWKLISVELSKAIAMFLHT